MRDDAATRRLRKSITLQSIEQPLTIGSYTYKHVSTHGLGQNTYFILESLSEHARGPYFVVKRRIKSNTYSWSPIAGVFGWRRDSIIECLDYIENVAFFKPTSKSGNPDKYHSKTFKSRFEGLTVTDSAGNRFTFAPGSRLSDFCNLSGVGEFNAYGLLKGKTVGGWRRVP